MRGEYKLPDTKLLMGTGSPPLARGILLIFSSYAVKPRITPACAGNTGHEMQLNSHYLDHPRLRGEYQVTPSMLFADLGSPPLARGILQSVAATYLSVRITPACAGNTLDGRLIQLSPRDHPRVRGEYGRR